MVTSPGKNKETSEILNSLMYSLWCSFFEMVKAYTGHDIDHIIEAEQHAIEITHIQRENIDFRYLELVLVDKDQKVHGSIMIRVRGDEFPNQKQIIKFNMSRPPGFKTYNSHIKTEYLQELKVR